MASSQRPEMETLTLNHILSDLDALSPNAALLGLASSTPPSTAQAATPRDGKNLLASFEANTFTTTNTAGSSVQNRKDYVALSHELLANFQNAQRLNTEQVSADQVGLLLPSERNRAGHSSSSTNVAGGSRSSDGSTRAKATGTRTDLLHAKVADLQTQVDAWDTALESAVKLADDPKSTHREDAGTSEPHTTAESGAREAILPPTLEQSDHVNDVASEEPIPSGSNKSHPSTQASRSEDEEHSTEDPALVMSAHTDPVDREFQDDDPWNELA